ncbi:MAG: CBS domain-containing protein [Roseiflexaceae bacterium]
MATRTLTHPTRDTWELTVSVERVPVVQEIRYWMRTPAITVNLAAPLGEALAQMHEHDVRRLPVVRDTGALCGVITLGDIRGADILRAAGVDRFDVAGALQHINVSQVMAEQPISITPATGLREAAMLMIENKIGGLPVVDAEHMVIGIITESDLFEALVQQLDTAAGATG